MLGYNKFVELRLKNVKPEKSSKHTKWPNKNKNKNKLSKV